MLSDDAEIPSNVIIDGEYGYTVNIPATKQGYPGWWRVQPEAYAKILEMRRRYGVVIDDGIEEFEAENKAE